MQAHGHGGAAPLWLRVAVFAVGVVVGWLLSQPVNRLLGRFFDGFNWVFDVDHRRLRRDRHAACCARGSSADCLRRPDGPDLSSASAPHRRASSRSRTRATWSSTSSCPTVPAWSAPTQLIRQAERDRARDRRASPTRSTCPDIRRFSARTSATSAACSSFSRRSRNGPETRNSCGRPIIGRLRERFQRASRRPRSPSSARRRSTAWAARAASSCRSQDRRGAGLRALQGAVQNLAEQTRTEPGLVGVVSTFSVDPAAAVRGDRPGEGQGRRASRSTKIHTTLQTYLGSAYVNDFSFQNRNWQVNVQADPRYRMRRRGHRAARGPQRPAGNMVPLGTLIDVQDTSGPPIVNHYNLYPSAELNGRTGSRRQFRPGHRDHGTIWRRESCPRRMGFEWTELTYQQIPGQPRTC